MKRIVFLTSTNLACNPRCLKEVELACELGYQVAVYEFEFDNWTKEIEAKIRSRLHNVDFYSIQTSRKSLLPWLVTAIIERMARGVYRLGWRPGFISAIATSKRSFSLYAALKKDHLQCDLIIAHNPGAFYPALWLSNKTGAPFAIDIEDFHPGENNEPIVSKSVKDTMKYCLPGACYVSFASPLIQKATLKLLPANNFSSIVVNNVFSAKEFPIPFSAEERTVNNKVNLVWFSQYISFSRGLEDVLPLLAQYSEWLQLTLIGNIDIQFKKEILDKYNFITIKEPVSQEVLNAELVKYDVGLAIESVNSDENRKICLTNKIWAYLQAGLYIWATNTPAQREFSLQFPKHTSLFSSSETDTLHEVIKSTINTLADIRNEKVKRWEINQTVNWEKERVTLGVQWESVMDKK